MAKKNEKAGSSSPRADDKPAKKAADDLSVAAVSHKSPRFSPQKLVLLALVVIFFLGASSRSPVGTLALAVLLSIGIWHLVSGIRANKYHGVKKPLAAIFSVFLGLMVLGSIASARNMMTPVSNGDSPGQERSIKTTSAAAHDETGTIEADVAAASWTTDASPIGVSFSHDGKSSTQPISDAKNSEITGTVGTYDVSFDNDYYLMADGSLAKAGSSSTATVTKDAATKVSLSLEPQDYAAMSDSDAQTHIESAAIYIERNGQAEKASRLKKAALSRLKAVKTDTGTLRIHYIDVGQGDSEFIELPNGQTMLIDAGPTSSGNAVVSYIKSLGYSNIDYVIASHPHEDHIGGMPAVLSSFTVGSIWATKASNNTSAYESFLDAATSTGIDTASKGKSIVTGQNLDVSILSPADSTHFADLNDSSVVILLTYKGKTFLFSGDASYGTVTSVCSRHIDILKVAHHGSADGISQGLVDSLTPSFAVISVGANNMFGLPNQAALDCLYNTSVLRTDQLGTIVATCKGDDITFNVATPPTAAAAAIAAAAAEAQASAEQAAAEPEPEPESQAEEAPAEEDPGNQTVYITETGKKYHRDGCRYLKKSKIATTLREAVNSRLTPCSVCNPPTL